VERTQAAKVHEGLPPVGGTHAGAGEDCEEEEVAEMKSYQLTTSPISHPPVLDGGRRQENHE